MFKKKGTGYSGDVGGSYEVLIDTPKASALPSHVSVPMGSPVAYPAMGSPAMDSSARDSPYHSGNSVSYAPLSSLVAESNMFGARSSFGVNPTLEPKSEPFRSSSGLSQPLVGLPPSEEQVSFVRSDRHTSFGRTTFNAINLLVGVGILSLPYAFKCGGVVNTSCILLGLTLLTTYTAHLLKKTIDRIPGVLSFADMGMEAFGAVGSTGISIVFVFELFTACAMYIVLFGDNLHAVMPDLDERKLLYIGALLCLPQAWTRNLKFLSYLSIIGILTSAFLFLVVLYTGLFTELGPGSITHPADSVKLFGGERTAMAIGLVMVGFTGHACFPNIYGEMKNKSDYPSVVNTSYLVTFGMYSCVGLSGYMIYGEDTMKEITLNLHGTVMGDIATWLVVVNPVVKFGLTLNPVALMMEKAVGIYDGDDLPLPAGETPSLFHRMRWPLCLVLRTTLVVLALVTAIALPHFDQILALCGSAFSFVVSVIFPIAVYLRLFWKEIGWMSIGINSILLSGGVTLACIGTWAAFAFPPA